MILVPRYISRKFIQSHPEWIFLYGSDEAERGAFGQMWEAYDEPNTIPIYTCVKMCRSSGYYQDSMADRIRKVNTNQIQKALQTGKPIIPFPKIGEGYSRMKEFAPRTFSWLRKEIDKIQAPITWQYKE